MYESIISIDLGASHTKVAYRGEFGTAKILTVDNPTIPSLAIEGGDGKWYFGEQAAMMVPDDNMTVYLNWKADLFQEEDKGRFNQGIVIAENFFLFLKEEIEGCRIDLSETHTRIAFPALERSVVVSREIANILCRISWGSPQILQVSEPRANAIGMFTLGKNDVSIENMFEGTEWFRRAAKGGFLEVRSSSLPWTRWGRKKRPKPPSPGNLFTVMFVDIGAFTTDVSILTYDLNAKVEAGEGLKDAGQSSFQIGIINQFDKSVFNDLSSKVDFSNLSFAEQELVKEALYAGEEYELTSPSGTTTIGGNEDQNIINTIAEEFVESIAGEISSFLGGKKKWDQVYLTGGGAMIPVLKSGFENEYGELGNPEFESEKKERAGFHFWEATGETPIRLATALGGASVIFQETFTDETDGLYHKWKLAEGEWEHKTKPKPAHSDEICRCKGVHLDCCFCDGKGFCPKTPPSDSEDPLTTVEEVESGMKRLLEGSEVPLTTVEEIESQFEKHPFPRLLMNKVGNLPDRSGVRWNAAEDQYLIECIEKGVRESDLAAKLQRQVSAIDSRRQRLLKTENTLFHFTDIRNIQSIRETGGLWAYSELERKGIKPVSTGGNSLSRLLDDQQGLSKYVHLCLFPFHPMEDLCKKEDRFQESCFIEVSGKVLEQKGVLYTQGIANKTGMEKLNWEAHRANGDVGILAWYYYNKLTRGKKDEILRISAQIKDQTVDKNRISPELLLIARLMVSAERNQFMVPKEILLKYLFFD